MAPDSLHIITEPYPVMGTSLVELKAQPIDLSEKQLLHLGLDVAQPDSYAPYIFRNPLSIGGYLEKRGFYRRSPNFSFQDKERNIHLGVDIWSQAGTSIFTPLSGTVFSMHDNNRLADYGPTIILSHEENGQSFYSLYGHLSRSSLDTLQEGQPFKAGDHLGTFGNKEENGDWPPHVHIQLIRDMEENQHDYPGVCSEEDLSWYELNCPDPMLILR